MEKMTVLVVTPEGVFFDGEAFLAEFCGSEGKMGIYPRHSPLLAEVAEGELIIHGDGPEKRARAGPGFARILPDSLTILAGRVEWS